MSMFCSSFSTDLVFTFDITYDHQCLWAKFQVWDIVRWFTPVVYGWWQSREYTRGMFLDVWEVQYVKVELSHSHVPWYYPSGGL